MLPSPATGRRTSKNVALGPQLLSCETQRDLVFARARQTSSTSIKTSAADRAAHRTGILKPLRRSRASVRAVSLRATRSVRSRPI